MPQMNKLEMNEGKKSQLSQSFCLNGFASILTFKGSLLVNDDIIAEGYDNKWLKGAQIICICTVVGL